jgi:hypothetical protein
VHNKLFVNFKYTKFVNNKFAESGGGGGDQTSTHTLTKCCQRMHLQIKSRLSRHTYGTFSKFGKKLVVIQNQQLEILLAWSW